MPPPRTSDACTLSSPPRLATPGFDYNGVLQAPPGPHEPLLTLGEATDNNWHEAMTPHGQTQQRLLPGPLNLVVLGTSPTSGCGASDEPWNGTGSQQARPSKCTITNSWAEMVHALVSPRLEVARTQVWAKNAVGPSFYSRCLGKRLPRNSTAVVIELSGANIWGISTHDLVQLVHAVRSLAPSALIAVVLWPEKRQALDGKRSQATDAVIDAASKTANFDVLRALPLMHASRRWLPSFYACSARDWLHPNRLGHALLASLVARWLLERACGAGIPSGHARIEDSQASPSDQKGWQHCYETARELPVSGQSEWTVQNQGSAEKGIDKWGLVSTTVGGVLRLGPLPGPPPSQRAGRTACLSVCVGYLLSAYASPPGGRFNITCIGCECMPKLDKYRTWFNPFPLVDTAPHRSCDRNWRNANVSVTEETCLQMLWYADQPCYMEVTNNGMPGEANRTRRSHATVRMDALTLVQERDDADAIGSLALMYAKPFDYPMSSLERPCYMPRWLSVQPQRAFAARALSCVSPTTAKLSCQNINGTYKGYARGHVADLCALDSRATASLV